MWGDPCPNHWNDKDRHRQNAMKRLRFHHAYGYASLTVGSFKPDTTCMVVA